jgi:membrane protein YdbS with pleckstrin-like domain
MSRLTLLEREKVERELSPHVLSFLGPYLASIYLIFWTIVVYYLVTELPAVTTFLQNNISEPSAQIIFYLLWSAGIAVVGIALALVKIKWTIFYLYVAFILGGVVLGWKYGGAMPENLLFIYSFVVSAAGVIIADLYRSSHKYILTNFRIITQGGLVKSHERTLRYSNITDLEISQGVIGRIFRFGTIIPITASGLGIGSDQSIALGGASRKITDKTSVGGAVGGEKGVNVARTRSYWGLFGVHPLNEVKLLLEELVQKNTLIGPVQDQLEVQKEQKDLLASILDRIDKKMAEEANKTQAQPPKNDEQEQSDIWFPPTRSLENEDSANVPDRKQDSETDEENKGAEEQS